MNKVTVKRDWLIKKVKKNRKSHQENFHIAFEGYRRACITCLEDNLKALKEGHKRRVLITETAPEDHTEDYNTALAMLEAHVGEHVELDRSEFECYVQDDWVWKAHWTASNSKYMA